MSNVGRPRTGLKACTYCGSTERDSNGQCACRNVLYRIVKRATAKDTPKVKTTYNDVLTNQPKKAERHIKIEAAVKTVREEFPSLAPAKKAAAAPKKAAKKTTKPEPKAQKAAEDEAVKTTKKAADKAVVEAVGTKKYTLVLADGTKSEYSRKDAAVKNGLRAKQDWQVLAPSGKVAAVSDDLI